MKYFQKSFRRPLFILTAAIVLYLVVFSYISGLRHYHFLTQAWDMGIFTQTFWNTTHGAVMQNTIEELPNHLAVHWSPWLFVLVPGYYLLSSPYYLLIIQTLALALGALPLFLLAKKVLASERWALLIAIGYLLYPSLHWVNVFDFHAVAFFVPLLLTAFYLFEVKRWGWSLLFFLLAAMTKENAILAVLFAGLYLLVRDLKFSSILKGRLYLSDSSNKKAVLTAFALSLGAVVYFVLTIKLFMPSLGGGLLRVDRYSQLGDSIPQILKTLWAQPALVLSIVLTKQKLVYLFWLFLPVVFTPFLAGRSLILLVPGLAQNLLATLETQVTGQFQYDSIIIPGLWVGAVYGVAAMRRKFKLDSQKYFTGLFIFLVLISAVLKSSLNPTITYGVEVYQNRSLLPDMNLIVQAIPETSSVAANPHWVPHLSQRSQIYPLGAEPDFVDVLVFDRANPLTGFKDQTSFDSYLNQYLSLSNYNFTTLQGRFLIVWREGVPINNLPSQQ